MNPRISHPRAVAAAVALCGLLAGCAGTSSAQNGPDGSDDRFISGNGNVTEYQQGHRKSAQEVTGQTLDGRSFQLASLKGKVTVVNFWASWCAPCRGEAPSLEQVYSENKAKGVEFLGVNFKDAKENAKAYQRRLKVTYPSLFDADGQVTLAFRAVPPNAVPSTLVLDRQGGVAARIIGATTYSKLSPLVAKALAEK